MLGNDDVTVIVTCYNHQAYLEQCLESVLGQTLRPTSVIVTDDASSDDSASVIDRWLGKYGDESHHFIRHEQNRGLCSTLNEAFASVSSKYVCHISADDWMMPTRLASQIRGFDADPNAGFVASDFDEVNVAGVHLAHHDVGARLDGFTGSANRRALMTKLLRANAIPAPAVMMRSDAIRSAGGWDESLAFEDYDMWLRLVKLFGAGYAPGTVTAYRVHETSLSRDAARRRTFLETEAKSTLKHAGADPEWDSAIEEHCLELVPHLEAASHKSAARLRDEIRRLR